MKYTMVTLIMLLRTEYLFTYVLPVFVLLTVYWVVTRKLKYV